MDDKSTAAVYVQMMSIPTEEQLDASVKEAMNGMTRSDMETAMTQALTEQMGMSESDVSDYIADMVLLLRKAERIYDRVISKRVF